MKSFFKKLFDGVYSEKKPDPVEKAVKQMTEQTKKKPIKPAKPKGKK